MISGWRLPPRGLRLAQLVDGFLNPATHWTVTVRIDVSVIQVSTVRFRQRRFFWSRTHGSRARRYRLGSWSSWTHPIISTPGPPRDDPKNLYILYNIIVTLLKWLYLM